MTQNRSHLIPVLYQLVGLGALLFVTGCATTGGCPIGSEHQQFTERTSQMTVSRCKTGGKTVGPYQRLLNQTPRITGQYGDHGKPTGKWSRFDAKGKLIHEYSYDKQGRFHGDERFYLKGKLRTHVKWVHGKKQGRTCLYHTNGRKKSCGQYINDKPHGPWPMWDEQGKLVFTNQYTHGFANKHKFYDEAYYSTSKRVDATTIIYETHDWKRQKIVRQVTYKPCGAHFCKYEVKAYYRHDNQGKFIVEDTLQRHFIIDNNKNIIIDKQTGKSEPMFCREDQFRPVIAQFHKRFSACKKYGDPTMQRHFIKFIITDALSVYRVRLQDSTPGTNQATKRCMKTQLIKFASQDIDMNQGICKIRLNMITMSPQSIQVVDDWARPPSH